MKLLITGGAGYIASHAIIELYKNNHTCVLIDTLVNSSRESVRRVEKIVGQDIPLHVADVADAQELDALFSKEAIDGVIHFAGLKAVGDSVKDPLKYYRENIGSTLTLLEAMKRHGVKKFIFSSSATVYGTPEALPLTEESTTGTTISSPYGRTKYMIEEILKDVAQADPDFSCTVLRYFNPVGAHKSGTIGEDPNGTPNNLLPYISQVAVGKLKSLGVFGDDYETPDGTGVRDYIHVTDLATGHVAALDHLTTGFEVYNLCTGSGTSVIELVHAFEKAAKKPIPYTIMPRRPGDIASYYASPTKANNELYWSAKHSIQEACEDSWRWQSQNPNGYSN